MYWGTMEQVFKRELDIEVQMHTLKPRKLWSVAHINEPPQRLVVLA